MRILMVSFNLMKWKHISEGLSPTWHNCVTCHQHLFKCIAA
uniref:Phosphatase subunit g4-1 n=1 Tax=Arundo donax TaxID=35708 RepID=A0A0A9DX04_ARUDO